jgi:hypothetical protein
MSEDAAVKRERLAELVLERALHGLTPEQDTEMRGLSAMAGMWDDGSFERAASAVAAANLPLPLEPMPAHLRARVEREAPSTPRAPSRLRTALLVSGWLAAAACLALAVWTWRTRPRAPVAVVPPPPSITAPTVSVPPALPRPSQGDSLRSLTAADQRAELLASAKDIVRVDWKPAKDPTGAGASGDVVWSNTAQRGYMRFRGLAANDPRIAQYQLWIFDKGRDAKYPVDGGVFDVSDPSGEVVVPISAKLHVDSPTLFAVTVEKPGGVVVSSRKRIAVVAQSS